MPKHLQDIDLKGKQVFVRTDFNVPLNKAGQVADDFRIRESLPTINYLLEQGASIVLASHLGRPKGQVNPDLSLAPVAACLSELIQVNVKFAEDCVGPAVRIMADDLKPGQIMLLENLRFHSAETENKPEFSRQLADLADVYVNDAFGTAHRAHASNVGITTYMEERAAGFLLVKEIDFLVKAVESPERPFTVVLGGSKVSGKIDLLKRLADVADNILIGGGMAFTFLSASPLNHDVGASLVEEDRLQFAADVIDLCLAKGVNLVLPSDCVASNRIAEDAQGQELPIRALEGNLMGLDIGGRTIKSFCNILETSKTILWNGPMGVFEMTPFQEGTRSIAQKLCDITGKGVITIVGGGDSAAALKKFGFDGCVSHTSTGGGASLELLSGIKLPAFEALKGAN